MTIGINCSSTIKERTPSASRRYDDTHAGQAKRRTILIGPLDVQKGDKQASHPFGPVPDGWIEYTHIIEGVITDAYIRTPDLLSQVEAHYTQISALLKSIDSTGEMFSSMDIYIDPICDPQTGQRIGAYYLVDHNRHSIAFLREVNTATIGLPDVRSSVHLDNISSDGSTSPFTPEECKCYLKSVNPSTNEPQYLNWSLARINSLLIQSQIVNLHGEQWARADRTMIVTGQHPPTRTARYLQLSKLMFDCPLTHLNRLERVWTDRIIYSHHWKKLLAELNDEWVAAAGIAVLVWM
ncbi:hypothetical protein BN14_00373 [Rhizoctonia solani AG-1 IB]|uniref:Uncharacterized protein n=1 Tax=Thanatephorus cucumeris (strain AG1-IB / isolate 7/3/14) TaxID=1108050 RepID=M5BJX3_THACB|nr:hypothetical protein BN14_00373 [Rhizoctonia solani AG-1 IB]